MSDQGNLILCGPIVRKVDSSSVSVLLVTRRPCEVRLRIYARHDDAVASFVMKGARSTIALGSRGGAHAVVVTASGGQGLTWGETYFYDLELELGGGGTKQTKQLYDDGVLVASFAVSTDLALLRYKGFERPSFALPPEDPSKLRILHGSCRKPHGDGVDAMEYVDKLIAAAVAKPREVRPQQLFLTGDQIYADDVHLNLLAALREFAADAIGLDEDAEIVAETGGASLDPGVRRAACQIAKLTSGSCDSHLFGVAELYAMYLFVWSLEPWRGPQALLTKKALSEFVSSIPAVRRALANIATYMIFDDHEITDDWFIRGSWSGKVLGTPLGRRIVRNGLAAYSLFQHWGNDPASMDHAPPGQPSLLATLDGWSGCARSNAPVPDSLLAAAANRTWSWRWEGTSHEVIGLDTRTRRDFGTAGSTSVSLLSQQEIAAVLGGAGRGRFTLVVSAAPILGARLIEWIQSKANKLGWGLKVDAESWSQSATYEDLLRALLGRTPVLVLSGDVHFGFGASFFDKKQPQTRIVNFVSSSLKNMPGRLARGGLWTLGFGTDDELQSAGRKMQDGASVIVPAIEERLLVGETFIEEILLDAGGSSGGAALIAGSVNEDAPEVILQGATTHDRTDITGRCNLGDVRFDPGGNKMHHTVWYWRDRWRDEGQTARFWLRGKV